MARVIAVRKRNFAPLEIRFAKLRSAVYPYRRERQSLVPVR
jgi:hypothetical protein